MSTNTGNVVGGISEQQEAIERLNIALSHLEEIDEADVDEYGTVMNAKEHLDNAILQNL